MNNDLFDYAASRAARDDGIQLVSDHNESWLARARRIAILIAESREEVTSDDVRIFMKNDLPKHPNAWGAVFKDKRFHWAGEYRASAAKSRHAGMQRIWKLNANCPSVDAKDKP